ncbi:penicillin-binding protein 1C [Ascidiimonas sp. W6]|uniref:penicillin-binding protein 1C n=1 Tax=Ascidiimonas meishanensis TaxID=3128903 RepID=UPI0030EC5010
MKRLLKHIQQRKIRYGILLILLVAYYFCLPTPIFTDPTSTVIEAKNHELLGAKIATDGQWRFPETTEVPLKFKKCILQFEDQYFYQHLGFNPISIVKSLIQNIKAGKTIRGGSTLTQQVIRLSRKGKKRTYSEKLIELILATRLELRYSKDKILQLYASHAPFGGNVVGIDMASWRYFGVKSQQLSWAESATLAVLPNAPSLIYPGKNQEQLRAKRNRLLKKLRDASILDSLTYKLAIVEPLPKKPFALPREAPHLLDFLARTEKGNRIQTTIDPVVQRQANTIIKQHYEVLRQNGVHNAAMLIMDVDTRKIVAYVGNTPTQVKHQKDVDLIHAPRSTGSILKPFLYAAMLDAGELLPEQLVADIPTQIADYQPENFDEQYDGAVRAKRALSRSLNVPAVRLLQEYGLQRFRDQIENLKLKDINKSADHYGLTLILGGAESNLWDLCKSYASMAATLKNYTKNSSRYFDKEFSEPIIKSKDSLKHGTLSFEKPIFDAGSIYLTFEAMKEVNRPEGEESWEFFDSSKEVAWKTGTSFGNRDAWAIGVTKNYVVGVWVGNADGEGRPNMTGLTAAAPIMFDAFDILPQATWFEKPYDALTEATICVHSGFIAGDYCPSSKTWIPTSGTKSAACFYHPLIHLNKSKTYQVNSSCESVSEIVTIPWFVLPPLMEYYFKATNTTYQPLPKFREDCKVTNQPVMDFIYPKQHGIVTLPVDFNGETTSLILKLAHSKPKTVVFWYLDNEFIGQTSTFHEIALKPQKGTHLITVVDELGNELKRQIEIR